MRLRARRFVAVGAAAVALLAVPLARAQTAAPQAARPDAEVDAVRDQARALFHQGVTLSDDERWADALGAFEESMRLRHGAAVLLNVGIALRALGRYVEARTRLEQLLREIGDRNPALAALGRETLRDVEARIANVRLTGLPSEAVVRVDGRSVAPSRWIGPDALVALDPGDRQVEVLIGARIVVSRALRLGPADTVEVDASRRGSAGAMTETREDDAGSDGDDADGTTGGGPSGAGIALLATGGALVLAAGVAAVFFVGFVDELEACRAAGGDSFGVFCSNEAQLEGNRDMFGALTVGLGLAGVAGVTIGIVLMATAGGDERADSRARPRSRRSAPSLGCGATHRDAGCTLTVAF